MATPTFRGLTDDDRFKALDPEQQAAASDRYWDSYAAENPDAPEPYVTAQRDQAKTYIGLNAAARDAAPVEKRALELQAGDTAFNFRLGEAVSRGEIPREDVNKLAAEHVVRTKDARDAVTKLRSLSDPEVATKMQPAFEALGSYATRGGQFGSPSLDARVSDILPGGEKDAVKTSREAYTKLRDSVAADFKLSTEELDDVVKHRLDLQTEPVSRDALGTPYVKNEVLAQGTEATAAAINNSTLPWSMKQRMVDGLPERISKFKEQTVNQVVESSPELADYLGLQSPVEDPTNTETKGDLPAGYRYQTVDEKFARLTDDLNKGAVSQGAGGAAAGLLGSVGLLPEGSEQTPKFLRDAEKITQQRNAASAQLNTSKTQLFGTDAAAFGQGAYSVAESIGIGALTGGLGAPIAAERIAKLGKWGTALAEGINAGAKIAPVAGFSAAKQGVQTYDQALAAGKTPEEATKLAFTSAAIEFGVTTLFSAAHMGGVEDVGAQLTSKASKEALSGGFKQFVGKTALGITGEELEETLISTLDAVAVQAKLNPNMTVADLQKTIKDTALVTLAVSGPASALGSWAEMRNKPTYDQSTDELEVRANATLAETVVPGAADTLAAGSPTEVAAAALPSGDPAVDGASAGEPAGGDNIIRDDGAVPGEVNSETTPINETDTPELAGPDNSPTNAVEPTSTTDGGGEPLPDSSEARDRLPEKLDPEVSRPVPAAATEDDLSTAEVVPETDVKPDDAPKTGQENRTAAAPPEVVEPETSKTEVSNPVNEERPPTATDLPAPPVDETQSVEDQQESPEAGKPIVEKPLKSAPAVDDESTTGMQNAKVDAARTEVPPPPKDSPTGIKNAESDRKRAEKGLPERFTPVRRSNPDTWDAAVRRVDEDKDAGSKLVSSLSESPRAISGEDAALLAHEQLTREIALDNARDAVNNLPENADPTEREAVAKWLDEKRQDYQMARDVGDRAGSIQGFDFQARKLMVARDFSLSRMESEALAKKNSASKTQQKLTPEELADVKASHERIAALEKEVEDLTNEIASGKKSRASAIQKRLETDVTKALAKVSTAEKRAKLKERLKSDADAAMRRLLGRTNLPLLPDPETFKDVATVIANLFRNGIISLQEATTKMVELVGKTVRPLMPAAYKAAVKTFKSAASSVGNAISPAEVLAGYEPGKPIGRRMVYDLAKAHIIDGLRGSVVLDAVTADLQKLDPSLSRDRVANLFTDYGKTVYPSREEVATQLRNIRSAEQLALKIKDVVEGRAPLRSGYQRGDATPEVRTLQKQLSAAMREAGIKMPSTKRQIKTALDATKTRWRNEMADKRKAIDDRKPLPKGRDPIEYDEEAKTIRKELDQVNKDYAEAFGPPNLTDKQRLAIIEKSLTKRIADEEKMLVEGILTRQRNPRMGPWSPALADLQQRLDTLQDERAAARKALRPNKDSREEATSRATKFLQNRNEDLRNFLKTGNTRKEGPQKAPLTPNAEMKALLRERTLLNEMVRQLRADQPLSAEAEARQQQATIAALTKRLRELDRKIRTGDLSTKAKKDSTDRDPVTSKIREEIVRQQEVLNSLRKAAKPKKDPEVVRLNRLIKTTLKRAKGFRDRLRTGDFAPTVKKDPVTSDRLRRVQFLAEEAKANWQEELGNIALKNASYTRKFLHYTKSVLQLRKLVKLGFDIGAFTRQGAGFVWRALFHPKQLARAVAAATRSAFSTQKEYEVYKAVKERPNAVWDKAAGLHFVAPFEQERINNAEDIPSTDLLAKLPWWSVVGPVARAGERFQRAFTNTIRAVWFDDLATVATRTGKLNASEAKDLGRMVMVATGRGTVKSLEAAIPVANNIFLATRFYVSRVQMLSASPLWEAGGSARTKKIIAQQYGQLIASRAVFYAVAYAMLHRDDDDDENNGIVFDPRSSDFLKIKVNGTRVDPMAGVGQFVTILARIATKTKIGSKGEKIDLSEGNAFKGDITEEAIRFLGTKRNLNLAFLWDTWRGEYYGGKKVTLGSGAEEFLAPLIVKDTIEIFKKHGPVAGALIWTAMVTGSGVNTRTSEFAKKPKKAKSAIKGIPKAIR